jgi:hypothetical protein
MTVRVAAGATLLLAVATALFPAAATAQTRGATKTYRDERRGIEFSYASRRLVAACPSSGREPADPDCAAVYRKKADVGSDAFVAQLTFSEGAFEAALAKAGFQKRTEGWFIPDNFQGGEAEEISGPGWTGLRAITVCGVEDETGYHAAGGECVTAVLHADGRSVTLSSLHTGMGPVPSPEVEALIASVRFTPRPPGGPSRP